MTRQASPGMGAADSRRAATAPPPPLAGGDRRAASADWQRLLPKRLREAGHAFVPVRDRIVAGSGASVELRGFDQTLVAVIVALLALGLVMVFSATVALPDNPKFRAYEATFFVTRHALFIGLGLALAGVTTQIPMSTWERLARPVFGIALVLLVLVLVPFIGKVVNNSRRWIPLGPLNFQPSELAKVAIAMYAASYMVRKICLLYTSDAADE